MPELIERKDRITGIVTQYTEEEFNKQRDVLLVQWMDAQKALAEAKDKEAKLRTAVVDFAFDPTKEKGTERIELGNGYEAKAVKKLNYGFVKNAATGKIDKDAIDFALDEIEESDPAGKLIAERLVKWTPELSLTEYKQLNAVQKAAIDKVIVTTPGMPSLEIIEPKS